MTISKKVLIEELEEQIHPEKVEDVIFWALEFYAKQITGNALVKSIAYSICENIKAQEQEIRRKSN